MRLANKVALITGNSSGLGLEVSSLFAREGAAVAGCGRSQARGDATLRVIEEAGGKGIFVVGNITDKADVERIVSSTVEAFGRIDILVNNASIMTSHEGAGSSAEHLLEVSEQAYHQLVDTNLKGLFLMLSAVIPVMISQGGGTIVNVGSNSANLGWPLGHVYSAAKAGMASLTRSIAATYSGLNIRINTVAPGVFDSPMADSVRPFIDAIAPIANPMGRLGTLEEIAQPLLFLASDESSYVQGQELIVDGGQAIRALPPIDLESLQS